jgi:hypothetical protein
MSRIPLLEFSDREISRVYLARNTEEAERVERLLNTDGIDYAIEAEPFLLLPSSGIENLGLAFYVPRERVARCYELCETNGLEAGIVEE